MVPLAGYADRLSVRPGQTIAFKIANATGLPVEADIVRVISADPNPAGPGVRTEPVVAEITHLTEPGPYSVPTGSYAEIDLTWPARKTTFAALVMPTRRKAGLHQTIAYRRGGFHLALDDTGCLVAGDGDTALVKVARPVPLHRWAQVWLSIDRDTSTIAAGWTAFANTSPRDGDLCTSVISPDTDDAAPGPLILAARKDGDRTSDHFNGRIENPRLWRTAMPPEAILRALSDDPHGTADARWDFAQRIPTSEIVDTGPDALHGRLVNAPTRAVRGAAWTGHEMSWRHAPDEYAAVHFHDSDIDDCCWPTAFAWTVPAATRSAQYALILKAGEATENIPFFVVPEKGKRSADLAVIVSTFTYTVYANHARPEWALDPAWRQAWRDQAAEWQAYPHNPSDHPEYGWSTYNTHTDKSGIAIASWHRPMFNVRIGYLTYPYPDIRASGLRHYPADSHLIAWLEAKGYDYDLVTDWELHTEGVDVIKDYRVITTGSHPEYHTRETRDAVHAYRDQGGRFMYLGGNGFYWKVAVSAERDGLIEIRRAEGGIRAWAAEPGEYYNQFDGEYGGLWRRNGLPPQELTGVGFTAQGNFVGSHYRILDDARASRAGWILDGVTGETFGGHGLSGHGAAGFELDRTDKRLGTPEHAVVLARSEGHEPDAPWVLVPEERLTHITTLPGEPDPQLIHADLTFFETPNNGAVFSTGSITFCGSLPTNGFENDVSLILGNVLDRFLDPRAEFAIPPTD
jgi:N,N-dimethylformamidase beta subunit-like, C-terminal